MVLQARGPALSVVVVSFTRTLQLLERCLRALAAQRVPQGMETIVVRSWRSDDAEDRAAMKARFPEATWVDAPDGTIPHMRRLGVAASRGDVVALIEDDCLVDANWTAAILRAHQSPHIAVGGAVEPGAYPSGLDWAAYFCDYARFMLPFRGGDAWVLPGNNVSYKREVVPELLAITESDGLQEVFVHQTWHQAGKAMLADPRIIVRNEHTWTVADVSSVPFHHGRAFGGRRALAWSTGRKAVFVLGSAVLTVLHVARILRLVLSRRPTAMPLLGALPWIGVFGLAWAAGECIGYAAGPGVSLRHWR